MSFKVQENPFLSLGSFPQSSCQILFYCFEMSPASMFESKLHFSYFVNSSLGPAYGTQLMGCINPVGVELCMWSVQGGTINLSGLDFVSGPSRIHSNRISDQFEKFFFPHYGSQQDDVGIKRRSRT